MARRGWSASNYLSYAAGVVTAPPMTIAAWCRTSISGQFQVIGGIYNSASINNQNMIEIYARASVPTNGLTIQSANASTSAVVSTSTGFSINTWFHACGVTSAINSRSIYLNGGGKNTNTTSISAPVGINRTAFGVAAESTLDTPFAPGGNGDLAEVAIWNVALTDTEVLVLASGVSPMLVRPASLVGYWPLIGMVSPETNLKSNTAKLTMIGTLTASAHPRIFMPKRPQFRTKLSTSPGVAASAGVGAAAAVGSFTVQSGGGVGASVGTGAATGVSHATAESVGSSDGVATVTGLSTSLGDGAAAGVAVAAGVGRGAAAAVGSAAGTSTVLAQSSNVFGRLADVWTRDSSLKVNNGGVWVPVVDLFVNSAGVWHLL